MPRGLLASFAVVRRPAAWLFTSADPELFSFKAAQSAPSHPLQVQYNLNLSVVVRHDLSLLMYQVEKVHSLLLILLIAYSSLDAWCFFMTPWVLLSVCCKYTGIGRLLELAMGNGVIGVLEGLG